MIRPDSPRPSDVPDFTEAVPLVFTSRRKAEALPPLAPPASEAGANGFGEDRGASIIPPLAVVGLIGGALVLAGLILGWLA